MNKKPITPYHNHRGDKQMEEEIELSILMLVMAVIAILFAVGIVCLLVILKSA